MPCRLHRSCHTKVVLGAALVALIVWKVVESEEGRRREGSIQEENEETYQLLLHVLNKQLFWPKFYNYSLRASSSLLVGGLVLFCVCFAKSAQWIVHFKNVLRTKLSPSRPPMPCSTTPRGSLAVSTTCSTSILIAGGRPCVSVFQLWISTDTILFSKTPFRFTKNCNWNNLENILNTWEVTTNREPKKGTNSERLALGNHKKDILNML